MIPSSVPLYDDVFSILSPADAVLDIGCGFGRTCSELSARGFRNLIGIDINSSGIAHARSHVALAGLRFLVGDATALPFRDRAFSGAIMQALLTAIPKYSDRQKVFGEAARVLKPGGGLYIACFAQSWHLQKYRERYLSALSEGYDEGTFPVFDSEGNLEYAAHHHSEKELVFLIENSGLAIVSFRYERFITRSGQAVNGMVVCARRDLG